MASADAESPSNHPPNPSVDTSQSQGPPKEDVKTTKSPDNPPDGTEPKQDKAAESPDSPTDNTGPDQDVQATESPGNPPSVGQAEVSGTDPKDSPAIEDVKEKASKYAPKKPKKNKKGKQSEDEKLLDKQMAFIMGIASSSEAEFSGQAELPSPVQRTPTTSPVKKCATAIDKPAINPAPYYNVDIVSRAVALCKARFEAEALKSRPKFKSSGVYKTFGFMTETRRDVQKKLFRTLINFEQNELIGLMRELWQEEEREYQYLVLDFLKLAGVTIIRSAGHKDLMDLLEYIVTTKPDFDTVDELATHHLPTLAYLEPGETWPRMDTWINQPSPWLRRAAIMHQKGMGDFTDKQRLFRYCKLQFQKPFMFPALIDSAVESALEHFAQTYHVNDRRSGAVETVEFIDKHLDSMSPAQKKNLRALKARLELAIQALRDKQKQNEQAQIEQNRAQREQNRVQSKIASPQTKQNPAAEEEQNPAAEGEQNHAAQEEQNPEAEGEQNPAAQKEQNPTAGRVRTFSS